MDFDAPRKKKRTRKMIRKGAGAAQAKKAMPHDMRQHEMASSMKIRAKRIARARAAYHDGATF